MDTIVVGVDGSDAANKALRWAITEADVRGGRVVAVLAYTYLDQHHLPGESSFDPQYSQEDAEKVLDAIIGGVVADMDPNDGFEIERRAVLELPAKALLEEAADADLLVVGSRGRGGFKGLLLGSVSQQIVTHAPCPVVVHRGSASRG